MERMKMALWASALGTIVASPASAALEYIGTGASAHGSHALIYDTDLDVTWYDYSNTYLGGTWYNQMAWAQALSVTIEGVSYDNWRLPATVQPDPNASAHGLPWDPPAGVVSDFGYNCILSELGHLYYTELGNSSGALTQVGNFSNLVPYGYWSITGYNVPDPSYFAWDFDFGSGYQYVLDKGYLGLFAVAVHPGRVVPEPAMGLTLLTMGAALLRRRM